MTRVNVVEVADTLWPNRDPVWGELVETVWSDYVVYPATDLDDRDKLRTGVMIEGHIKQRGARARGDHIFMTPDQARALMGALGRALKDSETA